jgi:hypothetical protein
VNDIASQLVRWSTRVDYQETYLEAQVVIEAGVLVRYRIRWFKGGSFQADCFEHSFATCEAASHSIEFPDIWVVAWAFRHVCAMKFKNGASHLFKSARVLKCTRLCCQKRGTSKPLWRCLGGRAVRRRMNIRRAEAFMHFKIRLARSTAQLCALSYANFPASECTPQLVLDPLFNPEVSCISDFNTRKLRSRPSL